MKVNLEKAIEFKNQIIEDTKRSIAEDNDNHEGYEEWAHGWNVGFARVLNRLIESIEKTGEISDDLEKFIAENCDVNDETEFDEGVYDGCYSGFSLLVEKIKKDKRMESKWKTVEEGVDCSNVEESLSAKIDKAWEEKWKASDKWLESKKALEVFEKQHSDKDIWASMSKEEQKEFKQKESSVRKEYNYFSREADEYWKIIETLRWQLYDERHKNEEGGE